MTNSQHLNQKIYAEIGNGSLKIFTREQMIILNPKTLDKLLEFLQDKGIIHSIDANTEYLKDK